jgi:hypothetical protein
MRAWMWALSTWTSTRTVRLSRTARRHLQHTIPLPSHHTGGLWSAELKAVTGQPHSPFVFVRGVHVPTATFLPSLKAPGDAAKQLLAQHGVEATGYFRP